MRKRPYTKARKAAGLAKRNQLKAARSPAFAKKLRRGEVR